MQLAVLRKFETIKFPDLGNISDSRLELIHKGIDSQTFDNVALLFSAEGKSEVWKFSSYNASTDGLKLDNFARGLISKPFASHKVSSTTPGDWRYGVYDQVNLFDFAPRERFQVMTNEWCASLTGELKCKVLATIPSEVNASTEVKNCLDLILSEILKNAFNWWKHLSCLCLLSSEQPPEHSFQPDVEVFDSHLLAKLSLRFKLLSETELEVLRFITEGLTNSEIAQRLYLSEAIVRNTISQLYTLIGATNRAHAASITMQWMTLRNIYSGHKLKTAKSHRTPLYYDKF